MLNFLFVEHYALHLPRFILMQQLIQHIKKGLLILISIQIINLGLFAQDLPKSIVNGQEQNVINSITEYVAEMLLGKTNAFPEEHQNRHDKTPAANHFKIQLFECYRLIPSNFNIPTTITDDKIIYSLVSENSFRDYIVEITPPPPKV